MNRIRMLREEKKLSQEYIGKLLGVSDRAIANYETEKRDIPTKSKIILADFFNVTLDYLMGISNIRNPYNENNIIDPFLLELSNAFKNYTPPTKEQKEKIEEYAKFILQNNKKDENK